LHAVIDALPEDTLDEVSRYLAAHCDDPVLRSLLLAPPEDEEMSPEELAMLQAARADRAAGTGRYVSDEELARRIEG
jgi:hypothetical protein